MRQKLNTDRNLQSSIISVYHFLKTRTAFEILDKDNGRQIFPINQRDSNYSTELLNSLCDILGVQTLESHVSFLDRDVHIMKTKQSFFQFLNRASGRIHDAILSTFLTTFFSILPMTNPMGTHSDFAEEEVQKFAPATQLSKSFITSSEYSGAFRHACVTARREVFSAGNVACRNVSCCYSKTRCAVLPPVTRDDIVSVYFLGFVILKVSLTPYFLSYLYLYLYSNSYFKQQV